MKKINLKIEIKRFKSPKIKDRLGQYNKMTTRGESSTAKIELNSNQAPNELYKTLVHEFGHFVLDLALPHVSPNGKSKEQLDADEEFCMNLEKMADNLLKKRRDQGRK